MKSTRRHYGQVHITLKPAAHPSVNTLMGLIKDNIPEKIQIYHARQQAILFKKITDFIAYYITIPTGTFPCNFIKGMALHKQSS